MGVPLLIHQPSYNMLNRWIEDGLLDVLGEEGVGCIAFTPLAQGLLTDKYLEGIPEDARINRPGGDSLEREHLSEENLARVPRLNDDREGGAARRLAQMALAWVLRDPRVTTALIGASRPSRSSRTSARSNAWSSRPTSSRRSTSTPTRALNLWEKPSSDLPVD